MSERESERMSAAERASVVQSKRIRERREWTSERRSGRPSTLRVDFIAILPNVVSIHGSISNGYLVARAKKYISPFRGHSNDQCNPINVRSSEKGPTKFHFSCDFMSSSYHSFEIIDHLYFTSTIVQCSAASEDERIRESEEKFYRQNSVTA